MLEVKASNGGDKYQQDWEWCIILLGTNGEDISAASHSIWAVPVSLPRQASSAVRPTWEVPASDPHSVSTTVSENGGWPKTADLQGGKWYSLVAVAMVTAIHFFIGTRPWDSPTIIERLTKKRLWFFSKSAQAVSGVPKCGACQNR